LIDVNRLIEGENKISSIQDGTSHTMHFVDARSKKECTNEKVTGIWLEDLNFVQTPIEKVVSEHDPVAYINHLGQCEAWLMTMASVGAAGHGQVCLPNPEFSHLDIRCDIFNSQNHSGCLHSPFVPPTASIGFPIFCQDKQNNCGACLSDVSHSNIGTKDIYLLKA